MSKADKPGSSLEGEIERLEAEVERLTSERDEAVELAAKWMLRAGYANGVHVCPECGGECACRTCGRVV